MSGYFWLLPFLWLDYGETETWPSIVLTSFFLHLPAFYSPTPPALLHLFLSICLFSPFLLLHDFQDHEFTGFLVKSIRRDGAKRLRGCGPACSPAGGGAEWWTATAALPLSYLSLLLTEDFHPCPSSLLSLPPSASHCAPLREDRFHLHYLRPLSRSTLVPPRSSTLHRSLFLSFRPRSSCALTHGPSGPRAPDPPPTPRSQRELS